MSLIDEALKKARQEAARQDAAEREARYARVPTYVPPARRSRSWALPAVVTACLAVGVGAGMVISQRPAAPVEPAGTTAEMAPASPHPLSPSPATPPALPGRGGTPAEAPAKAEQKTEPKPAEKPVPEKTAEKPAPKPASEQPVIEEQPESRPPSPGEGERGGGRGGQGVRAPEPAPIAPAGPAGPIIELPQAPLTETRSYVREVPVEGGGTLRLNGIAFSEKPVALFGDRVLAPGESLDGFTVMEIEAKRVKLQGPGGTVYVSLQ